jgi:phosphoribosylformimino-5-aminoimidazole carboxamide ribotide isomerase
VKQDLTFFVHSTSFKKRKETKMNIFPAIDLINGQVVRLYKGDYDKVTVYGSDPLSVAKDFERAGAEFIHIVDLDAAKDGNVHNFDIVKSICDNTKLKVEIGGGIRSMETVKTYIDAGVWRVIIGTAAVTDPAFLDAALAAYGDKIAVGVDIRDGKVAIKGWTEVSALDCFDFCKTLVEKGVSTVICTDISKDGLLGGTNLALYAELVKAFPTLNITASGGVSSVDDVQKLNDMNLYGAILGKALYTGNLDLGEALKITGEVAG